MNRLLVVICAVLLLASCVPNRKYVYLQKDDVKKKDIPVDTVLRTYPVEMLDTKIESGDVLAIRFESLTVEEFDFLNGGGNAAVLANPQAALIFGELVDEKGEVIYPVIGPVKVGGLSIFEAQTLLQKHADEFLESPKVSVRIVNFRVTVLGEVKREGQIPIANNRASMIEVLGIAGGLAEMADRSKIKVLRMEHGEMKVHYVNLLDEKFVTSPFYFAHQNDIIIVPPLKQRAFRNYFGPNLALVVSTVSVLLLAFNLIK